MILFIRAMLSKLKTQVGNFTYAQKALLGSFIFLSIYSVSLLAFATTYLSPGFTLDPAGGPGSYAVTPSLTYGGTVTSGHDGEVLYVDASGNLASDSYFTRNSTNGDTFIGEDFGGNNLGRLQISNSRDSISVGYQNTATGERAQFAAGGGPIALTASYEDGVSILGEFILANGGNTLAWDADTTDDLSDFFIQAQNISGAGIDGTLIGHIDSVTSDHTLSSWGDFTGQGGQAFQAITSVGSGNIEVGHTVSPANGYQIQYADIGGTTTIAHLSLDGSENILGFDTNANDTIEYGLQQSEDIKGLGLVSGSFNFYEDTSSDLVAISGSGDGTPSGGSPATSIMLTKSTVTDDIAAFQTSYDPGFPEVNAIGQVVNGTNMSALILNSTDSDLLFSADSFATSSGFTANSIASYMFRNDGTTQWMTGISDGIYEIKDYTNSKDYFKVDMTSGLYQLGDIDSALNDTLFTVNDTNKTITGTSVISGTKNTSMKVGSIPGLSLPGSAFDYSDSVTGQSSSIGVGDFSGIGGNSNTGYMTWYTGATSAQSLLTTNNGGIIGLFTDGTGATYDNEFHLGSTGFTLSSNSGSYTFPLGDGLANQVLKTNGSGALSWTTISTTPSISSLTGANATNAIVNGNYGQNWQWNTLGAGFGLALSSSSTTAEGDAQTLFQATLSGANATSTQTTYASFITNTHTGTSSTNVAGYFSATGGTDNYSGIFASGYVGIGLMRPAYTLDVKSDVASYNAKFFNDGNATNRSGIFIQSGLDDSSAAGPSTLIGFADGDGGAIGSITFGSSATAYNTTSDRRLKENIVDTALSIDLLDQIKIRDFTWISDTEHKLSHGVIAQELYEVYPLAVTRPIDESVDNWMVDYSKLVPLAVKSIQDLDLKIKPLADLMTENNSFAQILRTFLASATNGITDLFSNKIHTKEICVGDDNGETCLTRSQLNNLMQSNSSMGGGSGSSTTSGTSGTTTTDTSGSSGTSDTTVTTGDSTSTTTAGENNSSTTTTTTSTGDGTTSGISTTGDVTSGDTTTDTGGSGTTDTTTSSTTTGDGTGTTGV